jgi:[acyl-carrier-protein] S-malonyltransferase
MIQNDPLLLMFPGQGSQYSGMAKDWHAEFKECRECFEEASDFSGLNLKKICFEGSDSDLRSTEITQPAMLATTVGIFRSLKAHFEDFSRVFELKKTLFAGHSLGEYSALVASGFFDLGPVARVVHLRGKYMQEAVPAGEGTMAALMFKPKTENTSELARKICEKAVHENPQEWVEAANFNSPEQIVISGTREGIAAALKIALDPQYQLKRGLELPVSAPFHSKLMKPAALRLESDIKELKVSKTFQGETKYIPNTTSDIEVLNTQAMTQVQSRLVDQITGAVRWIETVEKAQSRGEIQGVVEIGPGAVLTGLAKRISPTLKVYSNVDRFSDFKQTRSV